jgi:hypothetical protein
LSRIWSPRSIPRPLNSASPIAAVPRAQRRAKRHVIAEASQRDPDRPEAVMRNDLIAFRRQVQIGFHRAPIRSRNRQNRIGPRQRRTTKRKAKTPSGPNRPRAPSRPSIV